MPAVVEAEAERLRLIALIHHPLAFETGLAPETALRLREGEQRALAAVQRVIAPSATTARALQQYGVLPARIAVVNPGTDPAPAAAGSGSDSLHLLCVATLTPRKGHALLIEALGTLHDSAWRLTCVGSTSRDLATAQALRHQIAALGLTDRITLTGEVDDAMLARCYDSADAFVLASHYEGYGMVFAEALARGLPIVGTCAGAIPETVPSSAGLLVPAGDAGALATALRRLLEDAELRARLAAGARLARKALPSWKQACATFAAAVAGTTAA
jgi:glycosyltransferase involved in cell wall biosynthesis